MVRLLRFEGSDGQHGRDRLPAFPETVEYKSGIDERTEQDG